MDPHMFDGLGRLFFVATILSFAIGVGVGVGVALF